MSILHPEPPRTQGSHAEELACRYLLRQGLQLITRNYRCRRGEIDLIMRDADNLVFVEVRYRRQTRYGSGLESVDRRKQQRIACCAAHYLQRHPRAAAQAARFDVVALAPDVHGTRIEWIRNAFNAT